MKFLLLLALAGCSAAKLIPGQCFTKAQQESWTNVYYKVILVGKTRYFVAHCQRTCPQFQLVETKELNEIYYESMVHYGPVECPK